MELDGGMQRAVVGWDLSRVVFRDLERDYPMVERGEGIYLYDTKGRKYIDGSGGSSVVTCIGHGNGRVAAVMAEQARTIAFSPAHCFANKPHIELCNRIAEIAPPGMKHSFLLSGGSEATENAVKFARQYEFERNNRGKTTVIGRWQGFHGNTFGAMTVSGITYRRRIYGPMMGHSVKIPPCYCYRCDWGLSYGKCNLECARALRKAIRQEGPENVLAFIAEPVVGAALGAVPARFGAEAELAAQLQHPNIVAIHEIGEQDGLPYFTMDFVPGRSLADLVRDQPLPARPGDPRDRLRDVPVEAFPRPVGRNGQPVRPARPARRSQRDCRASRRHRRRCRRSKPVACEPSPTVCRGAPPCSAICRQLQRLLPATTIVAGTD